MPKLSIIIPHYNSPGFLKKLLKSIPRKKDIEVIVIDDRSTKKLKKLNQLMENNNFSDVIFLKNDKKSKGAGACRNIGLEKAKGDWVLFADADDYFLNGFYKVVSKYFNTNNDVVFFPPTSIYVDSGEKSERHENFVKVLNKYLEKQTRKNELYLKYNIPNPISKLIKKEFIEINGLRFDEVIASNDVMFSAKVGYHLEEFTVDTKIIYCITRNRGSLTVTRNEEVFDSRLYVHINKIKFMQDKLTEKDLSFFTFSGQGFIFNSIKYKFGIKKVIEVVKKFSEEDIPLFNKKIFNPIYLFRKLRRHYFIEKNNAKYISK